MRHSHEARRHRGSPTTSTNLPTVGCCTRAPRAHGAATSASPFAKDTRGGCSPLQLQERKKGRAGEGAPLRGSYQAPSELNGMHWRTLPVGPEATY